MILKIVSWTVVMFFALGWTYGMFFPYYSTRQNIMIVGWWWISIIGVLILQLSPLHLLYIMPLALIFSMIIPGLTGTIAILAMLALIHYLN